MSAPTKKTASALEDYLGLFRALEALGVEFVVIGGGAVGAYARLVGDTVFSDDLDIFVTQAGGGQSALESALRSQKSFWKDMAIFACAMMAMFAVGLVFGFLVGRRGG